MFIFFVVFLVVPVAGTFWWSTRSGGLLGVTQNVGLQNYSEIPLAGGRHDRREEHASTSP